MKTSTITPAASMILALLTCPTALADEYGKGEDPDYLRSVLSLDRVDPDDYVRGCSTALLDNPSRGVSYPRDICEAEFKTTNEDGRAAFYCRIRMPGTAIRCVGLLGESDDEPTLTAAVHEDEEANDYATFRADDLELQGVRTLQEQHSVAFPGTGSICWSSVGEIGCRTGYRHGFTLRTDGTQHLW